MVHGESGLPFLQALLRVSPVLYKLGWPSPWIHGSVLVEMRGEFVQELNYDHECSKLLWRREGSYE